MVSHSSTSCSRRWSSGPFTPRRAIATANACAVMSNLSFGSGGLDCSSSKAHLPHVSLLSQPGTRPGIRPVMRGDRRRGRSSSRVFLSPFGHRHSLLGHPVPPGASAPLTVGLPRHHRQHGPERGFHVPHARDPAGIGRPLYPGGDGVDATEEWCPVAAAASQRPAPVTPALHSVPGCVYHEASTRIHSIRPSSLPLTCDPQTERAVLGLSPELHTPRHQVPERTSGQGQVFDTDPSYVSGISRPPTRNHSQRATSCRNHR